MNKEKVIFIIGLVWPEPTSSAAGKRMLQLIDVFLKSEFKIMFASTALIGEHSFKFDSKKIKCIPIQLNDDSFDDLIKKINPDFVMFDRFVIEEQFGWRVRESCPDTITILDSEDLHCLRYERERSIKNGDKDFNLTLKKLKNSKETIRELASILRCDLNLIISEYEIQLLINEFQIHESILFYYPILSDEIDAFKRIYKFEEKNDFIFIGNFLHAPNLDSVIYLKNVIWPQLSSKLPDAKLNIYGAYAPQQVLEMNNVEEKFIVHGRAVNALDVLSKSRILIAPLRFGAGLKGKIIEAMQVETVFVTSKIGAEGICDIPIFQDQISNDMEDFVSKCITLYTDELKFYNAQRNGKELLSNNFSKANFELIFAKKINQLENSIHEHRNNNFIGKVINSNMINSNKYLSKWIEEKNKKTIK